MKTKEIEEQFDKEFGAYAIIGGERLYNGAFANEARLKKAHEFLSTLRQSVLEEVSNGLPEDKRRSTRVRQDLTEFEEGFNDCLDQVTSLINNLIEDK